MLRIYAWDYLVHMLRVSAWELSCSHAPCLCMGAVLFTCSVSLHGSCLVHMLRVSAWELSCSHAPCLCMGAVLFTCSVSMLGSCHVSLHSVEFSCVVLNFCTFCRSTNFREMSPVTLEDWAIPILRGHSLISVSEKNRHRVEIPALSLSDQCLVILVPVQNQAGSNRVCIASAIVFFPFSIT